jgi:hypothetical protein
MLVVTEFLSEDVKYTPCIHTPTRMFSIKIEYSAGLRQKLIIPQLFKKLLTVYGL